jgi:putative flippase GtrA
VRIVRYFFVGGAAAAVDISLYALFAQVLGYPYLFVAACTFVLATAVNYLLSIRHVFESGIRFGKQKEVALVFAVSAVGLGINQAVLYVLVESFQAHLMAAKIAATGAVFAWNYLLRARLIFSRPPVKGQSSVRL